MGTYDEMDASEIEASPPPDVCEGAAYLCALGAFGFHAYYAAIDAAGTCQEVA